MPTPKQNKERRIRVWTLITSEDNLLGRGQGSFEVFYNKEHAERAKEGYDKGAGFKLGWKVAPCQIVIGEDLL